MLKKIIIMLCVIAFLTGCSSKTDDEINHDKMESHKIVGQIENVKLVEKKILIKPDRLEITFEKAGQKITLTAHSKESYDAFNKGLIADVWYSKDYHIEKIKFIKLEESK